MTIDDVANILARRGHLGGESEICAAVACGKVTKPPLNRAGQLQFGPEHVDQLLLLLANGKRGHVL